MKLQKISGEGFRLKLRGCTGLILLISAFMLFRNCLFAEGDKTKEFFKTYSGHYQDICIGEEIFSVGTNICDQRLELIKPILESFNKPFSVLDLGACEGYFSFRIAQQFPTYCHMVEGGVYEDKPNKLLELCELNKGLNVTLMNSRVTLNSLEDLSNHDHFDLVLAFLVIHQMADQKHSLYKSYLDESKKYIELLLKLGNFLIIETSTDVFPELDTYVENLCLELGGTYLGELPRYKHENQDEARGRFFLFTAENFRPCSEMISTHSFEKLNGVFK